MLGFGAIAEFPIAATTDALPPIFGTLSKTLSGVALDAAGSIAVTGSLAKTLGVLALDADGALAIDGALAKALGGVTLAAEGDSSAPATGGLSGLLSLLGAGR